MERLSSGKRINSASDDAAGLAIAEKFTSQIRGLSQAVKNGEQASSLAGTAEGALAEVSDILQRMRELTVQAANSTLDASNRNAIKSELNTLSSEIDRIASDTSYNGQTLLDGTAKNLSFQVGESAASTVKFSLSGASAASLGVGAGAGGSAADGIMFGEVSGTDLDLIDADDILINGKNWAGVVGDNAVTHSVNGVLESTTLDLDADNRAYHLALAINTATHSHGVEASAMTVLEGAVAGGITDGDVVITIGGTANTIVNTGSMDEFVAAVNSLGGSEFSATKNDAGGIRMVDTLGRNIQIANGSPETTGITDVTQLGFLTLKSVDGSSFTIAQGPDSSGDFDETILGQAGLMEGTFGGEDGNTYSITGGHIVTGTAITSGTDFTVNGVQVAATNSDIGTAVSATDLRDSINAVSALTGVTATAENELFIQVASDGTANTSSYDSIDGLIINGVTATPINNATFAQVAAVINTAMSTANLDIRATVDNAANGTLRLFSASGMTINLDETNNDHILSVFRADGDNIQDDGSTAGDVTTTATSYTGRLTFSSTTGPIVFGSASQATSVDQSDAQTIGDLFGVQVTGDIKQSATGGAGLNVATAAGAAGSLTSLDSAIEKVAGMRNDLGALQNRLTHTISNLETAVESHSRSRSLIEDTDYAVESAALARAQVLAQAGTAMLSQANAAPQLALQLLQ